MMEGCKTPLILVQKWLISFVYEGIGSKFCLWLPVSSKNTGIIFEGTSKSVVFLDYKVCVAVYGRGHNSQYFVVITCNPQLAMVSEHLLSKQGNAHLTLQVTLCYLLSRPHTTNINDSALTTISLIIIWLAATAHCLFHNAGHTLQVLN